MNNYNTDSYGFLTNFENWDINFCNLTAKQENISLTKDHIIIIKHLRKFYKKNNKLPKIRELIKIINKKYNKKIFNSVYLQILFPISPIEQSAKLAGLPKPKRCI